MAHPPLIFRRTIGGIYAKITNDNNTERRRIYSSAKRAVGSSNACGPFNLRSPALADAPRNLPRQLQAPPQNRWERDFVANWQRGNGEYVTHPHRRSIFCGSVDR
jgi:hypothetical protein